MGTSNMAQYHKVLYLWISVHENDIFPVEFEIKTLRTTLEANMYLTEAQKDRLNQLNELNEKRAAVVHHTSVI